MKEVHTMKKDKMKESLVMRRRKSSANIGLIASWRMKNVLMCILLQTVRTFPSVPLETNASSSILKYDYWWIHYENRSIANLEYHALDQTVLISIPRVDSTRICNKLFLSNFRKLYWWWLLVVNSNLKVINLILMMVLEKIKNKSWVADEKKAWSRIKQLMNKD